jgi:hypothetical protein
VRLPRLALAVALAFWGWRSGHYAAAVALALLVEAPGLVRARFELAHRDFARIADLCTVLFVALLVWLFVSLEPPRTARAVLTTLLWTPALLVPLVLAQRFSTAGRFPLSGLFRYLRKQRERDPQYRETELDFAPIYFAVCVLAAGIPNERDPYFYVAVVLVGAWALSAARPPHVRLASWSAALLASAVLGHGAHAGLAGAQAALEEWIGEFMLRGMSPDPYRSTTDLGSLGRLKLVESIVLRVYAPPGRAPQLLHRASFTTLDGNTWIARQAPMAALQPEIDGTSWPIAQGEARERTRMFIRLEGGKVMLALPAGTVRVTDLPAATVRRNMLGATQADLGGDWGPYTVESAEPLQDYAPPRAEDLHLPRRERATLERVAAELGLAAPSEQERVARIRVHLSSFRYATYRDQPPPAGSTPLAEFLMNWKSGHCEYFAAATTLLLRAAGIPARYATGFAVTEYSALEEAYVVRARHAHAWSRAYVGGRWIDIDTTPPSWTEEEERAAPFWQRWLDLARWAEFRWAQRGPLEMGIGWGAAAAVLLAFFGWRLLRGKRAAAGPDTPAKAVRMLRGADSEFYRITARLEKLAPRAPHESLVAWLARIAPLVERSVHAPLAAAQRLHYRHRFDPQGLDAGERRALRELCGRVSARLESSHG